MGDGGRKKEGNGTYFETLTLYIFWRGQLTNRQGSGGGRGGSEFETNVTVYFALIRSFSCQSRPSVNYNFFIGRHLLVVLFLLVSRALLVRLVHSLPGRYERSEKNAAVWLPFPPIPALTPVATSGSHAHTARMP